MAGNPSSGICWECCGFPSSYFFECLPTGPEVRSNQHWRITGKVDQIGQHCALCISLKTHLDALKPDQNLFGNRDTSLTIYMSLLDTYNRGKYIPGYKIRVYTGAQYERSTLFFPSSVAHMPSVLCDLTPAKNWISDCLKSHEETCGHNVSAIAPLRVIDCASRELRTIPPGAPYTCLSYVWGNTRVNREGFGILHKTLPKTIEDSMCVTLQLGMSYLWVDRYCINQQDAEEKHRLIKNMGAVYRGAALTIIAAAGNGPGHGIPGVNGTPRRQCYSHLVKPGQDIINIDVVDEIQHSMWNTRGWTYQEMILSRRRLVFTETQMYFQCNAVSRIEAQSPHEPVFFDLSSAPESLREILVAFPSLAKKPAPHVLYSQLEEYYERRLSYEEDIIKAFLGIINAFDMRHGIDRIRATHIGGLPVFYNKRSLNFSLPSPEGESLMVLTPKSTFLHSLMWYIRPSTDITYDLTNTAYYPSWSFASVNAHLQPNRSRTLRLEKHLRPFRDQEDVHVWVKDIGGISVELDQYVWAWSQGLDRELMSTLFIKSWAVSYDEDPYSEGTHPILNFATRATFLWDNLVSQSRPNGDMVLLYLGSHDWDYKRVIYRLAKLLVVEKAGDLAWRRIGLLHSKPVKICQGLDTHSFLNRLIGDGGWEMRTFCLV